LSAGVCAADTKDIPAHRSVGRIELLNFIICSDVKFRG